MLTIWTTNIPALLKLYEIVKNGSAKEILDQGGDSVETAITNLVGKIQAIQLNGNRFIDSLLEAYKTNNAVLTDCAIFDGLYGENCSQLIKQKNIRKPEQPIFGEKIK